MVNIDGMSLSIQIINFILLIGILNFVLYRPIRKILLQRKEKVSGLESSIEKSEKDAEEKRDAFALGLKDARAEGVKKKEALLQEAAKKEKEIISKINEEAADELAKVRDKIAEDAEGVRASLQKELDAFATDIGKKIFGEGYLMKIPGIVNFQELKFFQSNRRQRLFMSILAAILICFFTGPVFGSGGGEEHGTKGWVPTDTYRVMNFSVLAIGLFFLLRKPVAQSLNERIKGIKDQLSELEAKKKNSEKELAAYKEKLRQLDKETGKIVAEYEKQGNEASERILKEAGAAAEKLEEQAKRNVDHAFKQAKLQLQEEIIGKALVKAEEIIKTEITSDDQERLVDDYLEKVVA